MEIEKDALSYYESIFKLEEVQMLWSGTVDKVGQRNSLRSRVFIIASTGILLVRKKTFRQLKIVRVITYFDLISIHVAGHIGSFSSQNSQIRIKCEDITKLAFLVYDIRCKQFHPDILQLTINLPIENLIIEGMPKYESKSITLDRIITCTRQLNLDVNESLIQQILLSIENDPTTLLIDQAITTNNIYHALLVASSCNSDLRTLHFRGIKISLVLPYCEVLFARNKWIENIKFEQTDFADSSQYLKKLFTNQHEFKPNSFYFVNCNAIDSSFETFFDVVNEIGCDVVKLVFNRCSFTQETLSSVFQSIFFNECFHHMNSLSLDGTTEFFDLPMQILNLTCCNWVMVSKCMKFLSVSNCGIDASKLFPVLFNFDIGLTHIKLQGSVFDSPINITSDQNLHHIQFLDLRYSKFNKDSLISLLTIFKNKYIVINGLDISELRIPSEDLLIALSVFITEHFVINSLETLYFDGNPMEQDVSRLFIKFLNNQPHLIHLSINSSFNVAQSNAAINDLHSLVQNTFLDSLSLHGTENIAYSYSQALYPILSTLIDQKVIKFIDVTYQRISDQGLNLLKELINLPLIELYFDGSYPTSLLKLTNFLDCILNSDLEFASFPTLDFAFLISQADEDSTKDNILTIKEKYQQLFLDKYGSLIESNQRSDWWMSSCTTGIRRKDSRVTLLPPIEPCEGIPRTSKSGCFKNEGIDSVATRPPEIEKLLKECLGEETMFIDPIFTFVDQLDEKLSFETLLNQLQ